MAESGASHEDSNPWRQVAFEEVLGILQGWIGHVVHASIENPLPVSFLGATGVMRAAKDITDDYDLDQYDFELHPNDHWSGFALHRSYFLQAVWDGAKRLSLWLGESDSTDADSAYVMWLIDWGEPASR